MVNSLTKEQKTDRAQQIATAALTLFKQQSFSQLTMAAIAKQAGVSKGTLFNYYESKESLFMTLLLDGYQQYFDDLTARIEQRPTFTLADFLQLLLTETTNLITTHGLLVRLNALRGPILEQGANMAQTISHRQALYASNERLAQTIQTRIPSLTVAEISQLLLVQSAMISGMMNLAGLDEFNRQPLYDQDFEHFKVNLGPDTVTTFRYYLQGKYPTVVLTKE
ncbi:MAG: TetR/AcrR family transcriptional regulator [Lentilactobacillus hilgardii]